MSCTNCITFVKVNYHEQKTAENLHASNVWKIGIAKSYVNQSEYN